MHPPQNSPNSNTGIKSLDSIVNKLSNLPKPVKKTIGVIAAVGIAYVMLDQGLEHYNVSEKTANLSKIAGLGSAALIYIKNITKK